MKSHYVLALEKVKPPLIDFVGHNHLMECLNQAISFCSIEGGNSILLIVGPSHAGKSALLSQLSGYLYTQQFQQHTPDLMHVIGATAQTSREGRTTPKYIYSALLEDLQHPLFYNQHLERPEDYRPWIRFDETFMLTRLRRSMEVRDTRFTILDEGQYLTRAKDPEFKASLLESMKSLVTPRSSLIMAGGYERVDVALSIRAHVAIRVIVLHLGRYKDTPEDRQAWLQILKAYSLCPLLRLSREDLLITHADLLLEQCQGVLGMLEKRLIACKMLSDARGVPIDEATIEATAPPQLSWNTMRADIEHGESILAAYQAPVEGKPKPPVSKAKKKSAKPPFFRNAKRSHPQVTV